MAFYPIKSTLIFTLLGAALYLRVSTADQTTENQRLELQAAADRMGHTVVEIYADNGISGSKGRAKRPGFDRLLKDAARRKFEVRWRRPWSAAGPAKP